jgi:hypothetical protein
MDIAQKPSNPECYTSPSERFRINMKVRSPQSNQFAVKNHFPFLEFLAIKIKEQGFCNNINYKAMVLFICI